MSQVKYLAGIRLSLLVPSTQHVLVDDWLVVVIAGTQLSVFHLTKITPTHTHTHTICTHTRTHASTSGTLFSEVYYYIHQAYYLLMPTLLKCQNNNDNISTIQI